MPNLLTVDQIAEMLQVKTGTVYQWVHEGFVPHIKLGRLVRFNESEVMEWLRKRTVEGRSARTISLDRLNM